MRTKGKLKIWNDEKGFGFIQPSLGGKQVFIHISAFNNRKRRPEVGQFVTYTLSSDRQGRPCAENATLPGDSLTNDKSHKNAIPSIIVASIFLIIVAVSVLTNKLSPWILGIYIAISLLTFIIYAIDKSAAKKEGWRTKESTLHLFSLIGGWPGALVAQQKLRHKSKKQSFRAVFWVTVFLNCAILAWLFTPDGSAALETIISSVI